MHQQKKNVLLSFIYFVLSTIITWWFIAEGELLYISNNVMLLSCTIAGAKWGAQIIAALLFLKHKKWEFIKRIAFVCLVGSCILLPYCVLESLRELYQSFLYAIIAAVAVMILLYYKAIQQMGLNKKWFWGWMFFLTIAILSQIFIVFKTTL